MLNSLRTAPDRSSLVPSVNYLKHTYIHLFNLISKGNFKKLVLTVTVGLLGGEYVVNMLITAHNITWPLS